MMNKYVTKMLSCFVVMSLMTACVSSAARYGSTGVTKSDDDKALVHTQLARGYLQKKRYVVAKSELQEALRLNPSHSDANYVMGLLLMQLDQYEDAEKHFVRAVRTNPNNSAAAHDFGMFLCQTKQERRAVEYFEIAVSNPLFERAELSYMRAGECLAQIGDPSAEKYLKNALSANPYLKPALYRLAVIKYNAKTYFSARAYIERYMAITKPQPSALLLAHKIELKLNANDVAEKYRLALLEEFPGSEEANSVRRQNRD